MNDTPHTPTPFKYAPTVDDCVKVLEFQRDARCMLVNDPDGRVLAKAIETLNSHAALVAALVRIRDMRSSAFESQTIQAMRWEAEAAIDMALGSRGRHQGREGAAMTTARSKERP